MPKFKHINSASTFNSTKFSADANNSTYFLGEDLDTQIGGTPDILYTDIVFCKNNATIYTHGKFYGGSNEFSGVIPLTQSEYDNLSTAEKNLPLLYLIKE